MHRYMFIFTPNDDIDSVSYNYFASNTGLHKVTENYKEKCVVKIIK